MLNKGSVLKTLTEWLYMHNFTWCLGNNDCVFRVSPLKRRQPVSYAWCLIIDTQSLFLSQSYQRSRETGPRAGLHQQQLHHRPQHRQESAPEQADGSGVQETRGGTQTMWKWNYNEYTLPLKRLEWHSLLLYTEDIWVCNQKMNMKV